MNSQLAAISMGKLIRSNRQQPIDPSINLGLANFVRRLPPVGYTNVTAFESHKEPMFWKKRDRNGNVYWQGYDPVSNRSLEFGSDDEARYWLDRSQPFR